MTNLVKVEFEKTLESLKRTEFSSRFTQSQVDGWLKSEITNLDWWESELNWYSGDDEISQNLQFYVNEFENGKGDEKCPYDDEIQEWLNDTNN